MQKKIIALAIAGLASTAAFAQTNVTVYGVVDMYYGQSSASGAPATKKVRGLQNGGLSGSRIGFRGTEDLGNGLKALFTLEYGITPDVNSGIGAGAAQSRQSFLGLTGNFGTALAGRLQTQGYNFAAKYDAMGAGVLSPVGQLSDNDTGAGIGLSISARDALGRQDNSFAYVLPTFVPGLTLSAVYSFGTNGENIKNGAEPQNIYGVAAEYDAGPLSVGFVHHNVNDFAGAKGTDQTENAIGASYDFGVVKLIGSYQTSKTETAAAGDVVDARLWNVGVRAPVGAAGSVGLAYATFKDKEPASALKAKSWAIDYQYSLSKRTTAYVGYSRVSNSTGNAYNLLNLGAVPAAGGKESQFIAGMRHSF